LLAAPGGHGHLLRLCSQCARHGRRVESLGSGRVAGPARRRARGPATPVRAAGRALV